MQKRVCLLGSTGSIGTQVLDIAKLFPERLKVEAISTNENISLLEKQIAEFNPKHICITNEKKFLEFKKNHPKLKIVNSLEELVQISKPDLLTTAVVGSIGLGATLKAIELGIDITLANKETLVMAGDIVMNNARKKGVKILPIDSEHSAIFQSLRGNDYSSIENLFITCSGGPFFGKTRKFLQAVTLDQALNHPTWKMGGKITIDSSTLMNKGLEVIEAYHLFKVPAKNIKVLIHPQSVIHSMVEYNDGNIIGQFGSPNMRIPIQYALLYPDRLPNNLNQLDFIKLGHLDFFEPDLKTFTPLALAFEALKEGGLKTCIINSANEVLVNAFLKGKIKYIDILKGIEYAFTKIQNIKNPKLQDIIEKDLETREVVRSKYKI